ncbi:MAG: FAD-binding oxidoreductase [Bacteroidetes bacterium]|nr:FAD-binding oxidoreductase [Bacteroidota bacterium]
MIIKTKQDEIQNYLIDASNTKGFCDAVYIPENVFEVAEVIKEANEKKQSVTISGNGTGLTGARVPQGGIVISTEKLNKIIEINTKEYFAIVEPGVLLSELQDAVKSKGLLYPPDPTEPNCFIGGTVATNASGARTFKYGPTRDYVEELEIILPGGDFLNLNRGENFADDLSLSLKTSSGKDIKLTLPDYEMPKTKNASGYFCKRNMDAIDLFIGSEGTLGVITKIKSKLLPMPAEVISCILFFESEKSALNFLTKARDKSYRTRAVNKNDSIDAAALEFFDENSLNFLVNDYSNIPPNAKAAVWFEQQCKENEDILLEQWTDLFLEYGGKEEDAWFALTEKDKENIIGFRHTISTNVNEYITLNNFRKLGTDVAVPDEKLIDFYYAIKKDVEEKKLDYVIYGHLGNSHLHLNMLPKTEEEFTVGKLLYKNICNRAINLGGTFSAEHGVGKNKTEYLVEMYGQENVNKMRMLKKTLDPNYILGVGNIFEKE